MKKSFSTLIVIAPLMIVEVVINQKIIVVLSKYDLSRSSTSVVQLTSIIVSVVLSDSLALLPIPYPVSLHNLFLEDALSNTTNTIIVTIVSFLPLSFMVTSYALPRTFVTHLHVSVQVVIPSPLS